jgi:hypothetical protein
MASILVGGYHRRPAQNEPSFYTIGAQKKRGFKTETSIATGSSGKSKCDRNVNTITGPAPHFASFAARDRERNDEVEATKHPLASANREENSLLVKERTEEDAELPTFVSYVYSLNLLLHSVPFAKKKIISWWRW